MRATEIYDLRGAPREILKAKRKNIASGKASGLELPLWPADAAVVARSRQILIDSERYFGAHKSSAVA